MEYNISDIVKLKSDHEKLNRYLVIAAKEQSLNADFIKSQIVKYNIKNFEKFVEQNISVGKGFHYRICKIGGSDKNGMAILTGEFIDVFADDIER